MANHMNHEVDKFVSVSESAVQIHDDSEKLTHSFYQDFFGFSSEEWNRNTCFTDDSPHENYTVFSGNSRPLPTSNDKLVRKPKAKAEETNPIFRSSSGSFRYMRFKITSEQITSRSMSVTVMERSRMASKSKSRWQVFMFGFGSGKFPTKMDLSDIKSRQLRRQSTTNNELGSKEVLDNGGINIKESSGRRSGKKGWWGLVSVLGCFGVL